MAQHCYDFPRPAVTADNVILLREGDAISILLIQRKIDPYQGKWALPGGFMDEGETTEQAAHRELQEETSLSGVTLTRLDVFDTVDRDPRGRSITVAYSGFICAEHATSVKAGDDAAAIKWFNLETLPELAFDHDVIIAAARQKLNL